MPAYKIEPFDRFVKVAAYRVRYKDIFDLREFYDAHHYYLEEHGYRDINYHSGDPGTGEGYEIVYYEKVDANGVKEMWYRWRTQRVPENNPFYRFWLDFDVHVLGLSPTEIVKEGKKFSKVYKGEIEVATTAGIELDYQRKFMTGAISSLFYKTFRRRIFKKDLEKKKLELYREAYVLQNWMKQWFKFKRYLPYEDAKTFWTSYAWPSHTKE